MCGYASRGGIATRSAAMVPRRSRDRLIEMRAGKKLQEIINEHGLEYFRSLEEETLCSIEAENAIISTGG